MVMLEAAMLAMARVCLYSLEAALCGILACVLQKLPRHALPPRVRRDGKAYDG